MPIPTSDTTAPHTDPSHAVHPGPWRPGAPFWIAAIAMVALVFLSFGPALWADFVTFDDPQLITENPAYRGLGREHLAWMFTTTLMGHYQPLTWVSYAIDYTIAGMEPRQYHLTNILLHAASSVLVLAIILSLIGGGGRGPGDRAGLVAASIAAAAWALHPLRVESVAWVTERRDVLSIFFLLAAALTYLAAFQHPTSPLASLAGEPRRRRWYIASIVLLLCSLLSKAWGMSFFVLLILVDWAALRRLPPEPWRWSTRPLAGVWLQKLPYIALGIAAAVMAGFAQRSATAVQTLEQWPVTSRIAQAAYGLVWYLHRTAWPDPLVPLIELPEKLDWLAPAYLLRYAIVIVTAVLAFAMWRRARWFTAACAAYVVLLLPILGTLQSGFQLVADRYSYVALIAWSIVLAAGLRLVLLRVPQRLGVLLTLALVVVVGALVPLSRAQSRVWNDSRTLWAHIATSGLAGPVGLTNHGAWLEQDGDRPAAIEWYRKALELAPSNGRAWFALANALRKQRQYPDAERAFRAAAQHMPQSFLPLVNLASMTFNDLGQRDAAIAIYREAIADLDTPRTGIAARRPLSAMPHMALGQALQLMGRKDEAIESFRRALAMTTATDHADLAPRARQHLAELGATPAGR